MEEDEVKAEAEELGADGIETEVRGRSGSLKAMGGADVGKRIQVQTWNGCKTATKGDMAAPSLQMHEAGTN